MISLANNIYSCFKDKGEFSLKDAYSEYSDKPKETVRARIYDNLGIKFERIAKGLYKTVEGEESCVLIEGDGRDLSMLNDSSIDCILTDHPWLDKKSNKGGDRNFATYDCFKYSLDDFKEKARVLKDGCFLVEMLPAENENNYDYLYQIKKFAEQCGLLYYSKVTWKKGEFVSNTGRKSKNTQDVMIFSKGKARNLRIDAKKTKDTGEIHYMSGTAQMLPAENENNYDYLYQIKKFAEQCGLLYYSKVTWKKGDFVSNTGRKSKNTQDVMIFSKGKARNLRIDAKKTKDTGKIHYMSGTAQMLPAMFDVAPVARKSKIHQNGLPLGPLYSYPRIIAPL